MKFDNKAINEEVKTKIMETLKGENKEQAIADAIEMAVSNYNETLVNEIVADAKESEAHKDYNSRLGLRTLSKEENAFYDLLKSKQAITAEQIDIIPTSIIDNTMAEVKKASDILSLVNFAPADVKKWLVAEKTGTYKWGALTAALGDDLTATFKSLNIELGKLSVVLIVPKAIRDLSNAYVDKYFMAILNDVFQDGMEYGFLQGNGTDMPIGIMNEIDGTHTAKAVATVTGFSPKELAETRVTLSHNGLRSVSELHLICNPADRANYVDPALICQTNAGGWVQVSPLPVVVHETANCPQGKGIFTLPSLYTMGYSGLEVKEYDQTKALDDADVIIAKCYANGRATDDDTAVVFDITALKEFVKKVKSVA